MVKRTLTRNKKCALGIVTVFDMHCVLLCMKKPLLLGVLIINFVPLFSHAAVCYNTPGFCNASLYTNSLNKREPADTIHIVNTAIIPVPKLEEDSYNWWARHAAVLAVKDSIKPEILLIGDSITHFWGGLPQLMYTDGRLRKPNGPVSWSELFGKYRVLNLGFGWDRTQNVLWRLDHGEIAGLHPRVVVINIGTNNTSGTPNARANSAGEIVAGISAVCSRVGANLPGARIILMAIFPREKDPENPRRLLIKEVNSRLQVYAEKQHITFLNIGPEMLNTDGTFLPGMMLDYTHPTDKGYGIWANSLRPFIKNNKK